MATHARRASNRKEARTCPVCSSKFVITARQWKKVYCSGRCRSLLFYNIWGYDKYRK